MKKYTRKDIWQNIIMIIITPTEDTHGHIFRVPSNISFHFQGVQFVLEGQLSIAMVWEMKIRVLFFASARQLACGTKFFEIDLPENSSTSDLRTEILKHFPALEPVVFSITLAVNQEYVDGEIALQEGDEVAFIPPISGG